MRKKKGPPAGLPKSKAELEHEKTKAMNEGVTKALEILLYVLVDKFGWDADQLQDMMRHVRGQVSGISDGYVSLKDIERVLREEYGIQV
jgi:hypothetical protein